jgi:hypothetical protein
MENQINNNQNKTAGVVPEENLKSKVLELIEKEKIKPTTKLYFSIKDKTLWSLLLISILIGSAACSVMIFSFTNSEAGFYRVTHDSFLGFMFYMTPYLWVFVFLVFALIGYENFKHTNNGYKYSFGFIILVGLILNLIFGFILHTFGVAKLIDQNLSSDSIFIANSSDSLRKMSWNQPDNGILSGEVTSYSDGSSTFVLRDFNGKLWMVSSVYIPKVSLDLISTSSQIRVIGVKQNVYFPATSSPVGLDASTTPYIGSVVACYVFPWDTDDYISGISKIKGSLVTANDSERNISDTRNNNCKAIKSYNIIRSMVELK